MSGVLVCWRLGIASLLPGAVLFGAAILLYGLERLHLIGLLFAWVLHLVVGWVYVGLAPFWLPRSPSQPVLPGNPFQTTHFRGAPALTLRPPDVPTGER